MPPGGASHLTVSSFLFPVCEEFEANITRHVYARLSSLQFPHSAEPAQEHAAAPPSVMHSSILKHDCCPSTSGQLRTRRHTCTCKSTNRRYICHDCRTWRPCTSQCRRSTNYRNLVTSSLKDSWNLASYWYACSLVCVRTYKNMHVAVATALHREVLDLQPRLISGFL